MKMKELSWDAFRRTGDIDAYLLYKAVEENEKRENKEWKAEKQGDSSQDARITESQAVC